MKYNKSRPGAAALGSGIESLEDRVVMSLSAVAPPDFVLDNAVEQSAIPPLEHMLSGAHAQTGLDSVWNEYGFTGSGQTVAVIDSGIAWDHVALGNGYGSGYRVVGGWDFAENDADAYDDGLMGSHGTHVAGIIGADSQLHTGVAPGVDLVSLRVFDDNGDGYFSWVEDALGWVHDNRNAFENPITTVNLSLGTDWNVDSVPNWAMLEDEFAQLEADGIFIAVAAGNSFETYGAPGLSYPAVSEYVVPVMSVDDNGALSYFSQRSQDAIAAPGRWITSTVPDYVGNQNGQADDFAAYSGTSMASPYIAGASVLLREALTFVEEVNVTQDQIYGILRDTAQSFYDPATQQTYLRLDLDAAIDSIMPDDEFGSTMGTAHDLGSIAEESSVSGLIGTLSDVDYFTFTADVTGSATFALTGSDTPTQWQAGDSNGAIDQDGNWTFDVVQGQTYTVGIGSTDGLGYYSIDVDLEASFVFVDWGAIEFAEVADLSNSGVTWYRIAATRDGLLTAEARFAHGAGDIDLELYDAAMQRIGSSNGTGDSERLDVSATAGEVFYLKVIGDNGALDFRLANLVSQDGDTVAVHGTDGDDVFKFVAGTVADGTNHQITINGISYQFAADSVTHVNFDGGAGHDRAHLTGTDGDERLYAHPNSVRFVGAGFEVQAENVASSVTVALGGDDRAHLYDSDGDDRYKASPVESVFKGDGFLNRAVGFTKVYAFSSSGSDHAYLYDSEGEDTFKGTDTYAYLAGVGFHNQALNFDKVYAFSGSDNDRAFLYDSQNNDIFKGTPDYSYLAGQRFHNQAVEFDRVYAYGSAGLDRAFLYDSDGDDVYRGTPEYVYLSGAGFFNKASGFDRSYAHASTGHDRATIHGSAQDETLSVSLGRSWFAGASFTQQAKSFDDVTVFSGDGDDRLVFEKAITDGVLEQVADRITFSDVGRILQARDFRFVSLHLDDGQQHTSFADEADFLFEQFGSES